MSTHQVTLLCVNLDEDYEDARHRFEAAVPVLDQGHLGDLVARKASWADVVADADAAAPLGFFIFWAQDVDPAMSLNGNTTKCCEYLVGNHTIAERMFRIDPTAMLYVPLRVLLFQKIDGPTTFVMDQPSSLLSSLGSDEITGVGLELDDKILALLRRLQAPVPANR